MLPQIIFVIIFQHMILKAGFQLAFLAIEIILTFYSNVLENSLMVKFLLFVITAVLIGMAVTTLANNILPSDKDFVTEKKKQDFS